MPVKITGEKGHKATNQNNAAPKVTHKNDGLLPSKSSGSVTRNQAAGKGSQYKDNSLALKTDRTPMMDASHGDGDSMTGANGPKHGKSGFGKLSTATSVMSQALRKQKKSSYP